MKKCVVHQMMYFNVNDCGVGNKTRLNRAAICTNNADSTISDNKFAIILETSGQIIFCIEGCLGRHVQGILF